MSDLRELDDLLAGLVDGQKALEAQVADLILHETPLASQFAAAPVAGLWTPDFRGSTVAGTFTYSQNAGKYISLGGMLFFSGNLAITAIGTPPTGTMQIGGLPFASGATHHVAVNFGRISNFNYTAAAIELTGRIGAGAQVIVLEEAFDNAGVVLVPAANFTNAACLLYFSGFYWL